MLLRTQSPDGGWQGSRWIFGLARRAGRLGSDFHGSRYLDLWSLAQYIPATCGRPVKRGYPARLLKSPEQSSR